MSENNGTSIYIGPWVNWSHGLVLGSTVTLSVRNGAILTSFIATFVTIVGAQLWKILCFAFHQSRVSQAPKDGLYHQHQNVLRNSSTPGGAAWSFMLQSWHWWGCARHPLIRSLPWMLFSTAYIIVFAVLSVFGSSEIVKAAGNDRLLQGSHCGYWQPNGSAAGQGAFEAKVLIDSQTAATYARNCYGEPADDLSCNKYATSRIAFEGKQADCPFEDGICWRNNTYQMDTGLIDSHHDLGINTPEKDRLKYRRVTTCAVLVEVGYVDIDNTTQLVTYNYGSSLGRNYTFNYDTYGLQARIGYTVGVRFSNVGESSHWEPAPPLNRTDADVHLINIAPNSILYENPVDDPVFSAHLINNVSVTDAEGGATVYYEADHYIGVIACADQHQVCHDSTCTPLSARRPVFSSLQGLAPIQRGILERITFANTFTGISQVINGRSGTALRAAENVVGIFQSSLPSDQWQIEVSSWFSTGLVILQNSLRDYVSPSNILPGAFVSEPQTPVDQAMCSIQKTQTTNGTVSFSVLGLAILLIIGTLAILTSLVLESVVSWVGPKSFLNWRLDDTMQLQRMVFEARGVSWTNTNGIIPVTEAGQKFPSVAKSAESKALMAEDEKMMGVHVTEIR